MASTSPPVPSDPPMPPAGPAAADSTPATAVPVSLAQRPFVQDVLPFLISLALHAALIAAGLLLGRAVYERYIEPDREQIIIPEAVMVESGPPGGVPNPGLADGDISRAAAQDLALDVPSDSRGLNQTLNPSLQFSLLGGREGELAAVIGAGPGASGRGHGLGGYGDGEPGGALAPFGVPGGGSIGLQSSFAGIGGGNARKIVFVCDASGSMVTKFDLLRAELANFVERLKPVQAFNIVFFGQDGHRAADESRLMMAKPANKKRAFEFLRTAFPAGTTNPVPALELAFRQGPELIYLLTDGEFPDNQAVINLCRQRNPNKKIKIKTIAYVGEQERERADVLNWIKVLRQIAQDSGGEFHFVGENEIRRAMIVEDE